MSPPLHVVLANDGKKHKRLALDVRVMIRSSINLIASAQGYIHIHIHIHTSHVSTHADVVEADSSH